MKSDDSTKPTTGERVSIDAGSVTVEMVILAPVFVVLFLFVLFLGRASGGIEQVRHAADVGARAASMVGRDRMEAVAQLVADADLTANGVNCASTAVVVSISGLAGSGSEAVTVTVTCHINAEGLSLLGLGSRSVSATSTEVVDRYRGAS